VNQKESATTVASLAAGHRFGRKVISRRAWLLGVSTLLLSSNTIAHTPYGQWDVFRQRHLQILTSRSDLIGDAVADTWVAIIADHLPKSNAMVSRSRTSVGVASLLKTDQAKLAVLSHDQADALFNAKSPFEDYAPMPMQVLVDDGAYVLLARDDLPLEHGYVLVATLLEQADALHVSVPLKGMFGMSVHLGAKAAALGEEIPVQNAK
jgi:hypothetical protein